MIGTLMKVTRSMGLRYVLFRGWYEFKRKTGLLKMGYPTSISDKEFISLVEWKGLPVRFLLNKNVFEGNFNLQDEELTRLREEANKIRNGEIKFFNCDFKNLGTDYDWITNPDTGFKYDKNAHWTTINDLDSKSGDIKFVWEKSRFSFIYTLIRSDQHLGTDHAEFVLSQILDWIDHNPPNSGPNSRCSQETSLRILNWTFALYYYKESDSLTPERFQKIISAIYWQMKHVRKNINFSRIAVRNNHAITETMMLMLGGILFPFFPESKAWFKRGKRYFEKEIAYQIYSDGTFLQYSMNYHRVVIQLLTWAIELTKKNGVELEEVVHQRASRSVKFLLQCMNLSNGHLPNYGNNDGALFFPLNHANYRDYRPQLDALWFALYDKHLFHSSESHEDSIWLCGAASSEVKTEPLSNSAFDASGYYTLRKNENSFCMIRCGTHKNRPAQADNLHLDIWDEGINIMRDAGSYKYNADAKDLKFFMGTQSHNTVMMGAHDQMKKGGRFMWFNWSKGINAELKDGRNYVQFKGKASVYRHVDSKITHEREVWMFTEEFRIEIIDVFDYQKEDLTLIWNPHPDFEKLGYKIEVVDFKNKPIEKQLNQGYFSGYYGIKEETEQWKYKTSGIGFKTVITKV